jgi:GNAT superfamily N-acetyltransferase
MGDLSLQSWTDERIWSAVDDWRWVPPSARKVTTEDYELVVTAGSYALNYVYGFKVKEDSRFDQVLKEIRSHVQSLGGIGMRIQVTPMCKPRDLAKRLLQQGYKAKEEAEVLVWELLDSNNLVRVPAFQDPVGVTVREALNELEYESYLHLTSRIYGDPLPSGEALTAFKDEFNNRIQSEDHSDRFLAWEDGTAVGLAGLEIAGPACRLFGAGVLPEHRRKGVYGALVKARCEQGARRGAEIALTTARVGTSGPILKQHGFRLVGSIRVFEIRW